MVLTEAVLNECNNLSSSMHWSNIQARPFLLRKINWMQRTTYNQTHPLSNTRSITEYDIRIDFYKNKHPNIFVSRNDTSEYPNIFVWKETIRIWYEWIFVLKMIQIFEYSTIRHTLTEYDFDTNEYPNIFVSRKWYERISEYIRIKKIDTNECPNKYSYRKYSNIRIFEYIRHTLICNKS